MKNEYKRKIESFDSQCARIIALKNLAMLNNEDHIIFKQQAREDVIKELSLQGFVFGEINYDEINGDWLKITWI